MVSVDRLGLSIGDARVLQALDDAMRIERDRRHGSHVRALPSRQQARVLSRLTAPPFGW
jgi:hypothetical protein